MDQQKILAQLGIKAQLHLVIQGYQGQGSIYLSNYFSALHTSLLEKRQIKSVLTIAKGFQIDYPKQKIPDYLYISIKDKKNANILQHMEKCFQFIDRCRQKTNILIHCKAGVSRSVTLLTCYLMRTFNYNVKDAYSLLKRANHKVRPNKGFIKMLQNYNKQLYNQQVKFNSRLNQFEIIQKRDFLAPSQIKIFQNSQNKKILCMQADFLCREKQKIEIRINHIKILLQQNQNRSKSMPQHIRIKLQQIKIQFQDQ